MKNRRRRVAAVVTVVIATGTPTLVAAPANAAVATPASVINTYFTQRDQAWFGGGPGMLATAPGVTYSAQAQGEIEKIARISREVRNESGLAANNVLTNTASTDLSSTCTRYLDAQQRMCSAGRTTHQTEVGTTLKWNLGGAGDSFIGDGYTVTLTWKLILGFPSTREYTVETVALTPVPPDDVEAAAPTPAELGLKPASTDRAEAKAAQARMQARGDFSPPGPTAAAAYYFDPNAAAAYALRWANGYNPEYERQSNDCTNFVSQALEAGGWPIRDGIDPSDKGNWTPDLFGPRGPSKTWSVSGWLMEFATTTTDRGFALGRAGVDNDWNSVWNLLKGDIIFNDWGHGGADGTIDHAMIVDGYFVSQGFREPTISQHSNARRNVPASIIIKIAANAYGRTMYFYPVRTKTSFTS